MLLPVKSEEIALEMCIPMVLKSLLNRVHMKFERHGFKGSALCALNQKASTRNNTF